MALLSELLNPALGLAGSQVKIASARDAADETSDFSAELEQYLDGSALTPTKVAALAAKAPEATKTASASSEDISALASDAMKYASLLDTTADVFAKLAASVPQTLSASTPSGLDTKTAIPAASGAGAPSFPAGMGQKGPVPAVLNDDDSQSDIPVHARGKTAANILLQAKIAQASALRGSGQVELAELLEAQIKVAQDPSSPQPSVKAGKRIPLSTEIPSSGGTAPANSEVIGLTRAAARDSNTRAAASMLNSTPVRDPVMTAVLDHTEGAKVAGETVFAKLAKSIIKTASDDSASPSDRQDARGILKSIHELGGSAALGGL